MGSRKLQLALDFLEDTGQLEQFLRKIVDVVDIIEVGTPLIIRDGVKTVAEIKRMYPDMRVLADLKIADAGGPEAGIAFDAGADIVTVLGVAHDVTIRNALNEAHKNGKQIMVDLIAVKDVRKRVQEIDAMGVDYVCVHTAFDVQSADKDPLKELQMIQGILKTARVAVAGGIKPDTLPLIVALDPEIVIVGTFITGSRNIRKAALEIKQLLK